VKRCAQGAEVGISCVTLRDSARCNSLKPFSGLSLVRTFKQGVAGSNPARLIRLSGFSGYQISLLNALLNNVDLLGYHQKEQASASNVNE